MSALFQLISHEYRRYVFTWGFLLFILIVPISAAFGIGASFVNEQAAPVRPFIVIDETGRLTPTIDQALDAARARRTLEAYDAWAAVAVQPGADGLSQLPAPFAPGDDSDERQRAFLAAGGLAAGIEAAAPFLRTDAAVPPPTVRERLTRVDAPADVATIADALPYLRREAKLDGDLPPLFAVIVIPADIEQGGVVEFWSDNLVDTELKDFVDRALTSALRAERYTAKGVDAASIASIEAFEVSVRPFQARAEAEAGLAEFAATWVPLGLAYALFLMINTVGSMLLTSTVEEKSNKIVEVLLSSVTATQLMLGKLIGLALVGATIPALLLGSGYAVVHFASDGAVTEALRESLFSSPLVPLFFLCFVLGYLLYASIYLAVGAMSSSIQDAQSFVGPLTILIVLPLPFLQMIVADPNGLLAQIFTWIPLYTPYAVMMRISAEPPLWQLVGSISLLVLTVGWLFSIMGRIFRNGLLASGGAPTLKSARDLARRQ